MGTRAQVLIEDSGVCLYAHCDGDEIPKIVRAALARRQRWDDDEYLSAIIFREMIKDDLPGNTLFGIGTGMHGDIAILVVLNCRDAIVRVEEYPGWSEKERKKHEVGPPRYCSFEDFVVKGPIALQIKK